MTSRQIGKLSSNKPKINLGINILVSPDRPIYRMEEHKDLDPDTKIFHLTTNYDQCCTLQHWFFYFQPQ